MKIKSLLFLLLSLLCAARLATLSFMAEPGTLSQDNDISYRFLLLGVDAAAENSDVVALAQYRPREQRLAVMQLPRDLYLKGEDSTPKLNHIYASLRAKGLSSQEALQYTAQTIADAFSLPIDAALCLDLSVFVEMVDAIGGVPITLPFDMTYIDRAQDLSIHLEKGDTVLDGKRAEQFVRFRSGYIEGDLGRLDAQKLFFAALLRHVTQNLSTKDAVSLFLRYHDKVGLCGSQKAILTAMVSVLANRAMPTVQFLSLPGEAVCTESGAWYYVMNRQAAYEALTRYLARPTENPFDETGRFYSEDPLISSIYFSKEITYRVYTMDELSDINILKKD